ncbi:MAG: hypothetical protein JNK25_15130 [Phycisphaerae bacterium]|nr:hypothetical protein [Phycisphaerae bacterium]
MPRPSPASRYSQVLTATWPGDPFCRAEMGLRGALVRSAAAAVVLSRELIGESGERAREATDRVFADWMQRTDWPSRPLRIGLEDPGLWSLPVTSAAPVCDLEWFSVPASFRLGPDSTRLDAVVRSDGEGGIRIETRELIDREAAWFDWSCERPLAYPSVFPHRLDAAGVTLRAPIRGELALRLIEAAAVCSRHSARLDLADICSGRTPTNEPHLRPTSSRPRLYLPNHDASGAIMFALAADLEREFNLSPRQPRTDVQRTAARITGAYFATAGSELDDALRRSGMETAASTIGEEPQTMLRLAAVRLGVMEDDAGMDALLRADRMLRAGQTFAGPDAAAFIEGELEHGGPAPLTVGRLAAGVCLGAAPLSMTELGYFLSDVLDDIRFGSLLVGRDHDRALLDRVCREIERARRGEVFSLPAAATRKPVKRKKAA